MSITLLTQRKVDSEKRYPFTYDPNQTGGEILGQIINNLQLKEKDDNLILLYLEPEVGEWKIVDLNEPLAKMSPQENGSIALSVKEHKVKVINDHDSDSARSMILDLTKPVNEILEFIAEKLHYNCQANQYALFSLFEDGKKYPLDSSQCIAAQTSFYKNLIFKRRYFLIFVNEFDEMDNCMHVYRDIRYNYHHGYIKLDDTNRAIEIARLQAYGDSKKLEDVNSIKFLLKQKKFLPKCLKSKNLASKIEKSVKSQQPLDRLPAMMEFIKQVRTLPGFGTEQYKGRYVIYDSSDKKVKENKAIISVGPRGITFLDPDSKNEIDAIRILRIQRFYYAHGKFVVNYLDDNNQASHVTIRSDKLNYIATYVRGNVDILAKHYRDLRNFHLRKLAAMQDEEGDGIYKTLAEAEEAIREFLEEYGDLNVPMEEIDRVRIETDPTELKKDDYSTFNEIEDVCKLYADDEEFCNRIRKFLPEANIKRFDSEGSKQRLTMLVEDLKSFRHDIFKMTIKEASFTAETAVFFAMAIKDCMFMNVDKEMDKLINTLRSFFVTVKSSEANHMAVQDISEEISKQIKHVLDVAPSALDKIDSVVEKIKKQEQEATPEELAALPRGSIITAAMFEAIFRLMSYLYENRLLLLKQGVDIKKQFPIFQMMARALRNFWESLKTGNADPQVLHGEIVKMYRSVNPFLRTAYEARELTSIRAEFEKQVRHVISFNFLLQKCFAQQGETIGQKFYPGTLQLMYQSFNVIQDSQSLFGKLLQYPFVQQDNELNQNIRYVLNFLDNSMNQLLKFSNELKYDPLNEEVRSSIVHLVNVIRRYVLKIGEGVERHKDQIDIKDQFYNLANTLENFLFSLTPMNISSQRVFGAATSLEALIEAMVEAKMDDEWINRIKDAQKNYQKWHACLADKPTDGQMLYDVHHTIHQTIKDLTTLETWLSAASHETIPLIIELLSPSIKRTLANPDLDDEYENATHIPLFAQMHINFALVISYLQNVALSPQVIIIEENTKKEIQRRINNLCAVYQKLTHARPIILLNPYTFTELLPILHMLNSIKIQGANFLSLVHQICAVTASRSGVYLFARLFKSIDAFIAETKQLNIRPYRRLPTKEKVMEYRKFLIDMTAVLRNGEQTCTPEEKVLLKEESDQIMKLIKDVSRFGNAPTREFDKFVQRIENHMDGMYARTNGIPNLWDDRNLQKVEDMSRANLKIISGEPPTPELFTELINDFIIAVNNFTAKLKEMAKEPGDPEILHQALVNFNTIARYLTQVVEQKLFKPRQIDEVRRNLVWYRHAVPIPSAEAQKTLTWIETLLKFDDLINLTRQMPIPIAIVYKWQVLEPSISDEIPELADVTKEQFEVMRDIFHEILSHPLVEESARITGLINKIYDYFSSRYAMLKVARETLEENLESFCKDNEESLAAIIKRIKLLIPILADDKLIVSVSALQSNIVRIIKLFNAHHLTATAAEQFKVSTCESLLRLKMEILAAIKNGVVSNNVKPFLEKELEIIGRLPENIQDMKPNQIQQFCDELYAVMLAQLEHNMVYIGYNNIGSLNMEIYNTMEQFISTEYTKIQFKKCDIVNNNVAEESTLEELFPLITQLLETGNAPEDVTKNAQLIVEMVKQNNSAVPSGLLQLVQVLDGLSPTKYATAYARLVGCISGNTVVSSERMNQLAITCTVAASKLVAPLLEALQSTQPRTVYHQQLISLLKQIDTNMIQSHPTLESLSITFVAIRQAQQMIPLALLEDETAVALANQFSENIQEVDTAIAVAIRQLIAAAVERMEAAGVHQDFIDSVAPLLRAINTYTSIDMNNTAALCRAFLSFDSANTASIIAESNTNEALKPIAELLQQLGHYRPIMNNWLQPTYARQDVLLTQYIQSCTLELLNKTTELSNANDDVAPLIWTEARSLLVRLSNAINEAKASGLDVAKYEQLLIALMAEIDHCDNVALRVIHGNAPRKALCACGGNLNLIVKKIYEEAGIIRVQHIELPKEEEEEEEEKEEEEQPEIECINIEAKFVQLVHLVNSGRRDEALELLAKIVVAIEDNEQETPHKDWFYIVRDALNKETDTSKFIDYAVSDFIKKAAEIKKPSNQVEMNEEFLVKMDDFKGCQDRYLEAEDRVPLQKEAAAILSAAQMDAIVSFGFFSYATTPIYQFLIETIEQKWAALIKIFSGESDAIIMRAFRSAGRLLADLSYVVEDLSLQSEPENPTPFNEARLKLFSAVSQLYSITGYIINCSAIAVIPQQYVKMTEDAAEKVDSIIGEIMKAGEMLSAANTKKSVGRDFDKQLPEIGAAFDGVKKIIGVQAELVDVVTTCQEVHVAIKNVMTTMKLMTDVVKAKPDTESANALPGKFTLPSITGKETVTDIPAAVAAVEKYASKMSDRVKSTQKVLFKTKNAKPSSIIKEIKKFHERAKTFAFNAIQLSLLITDIEHQSELTEQMTSLAIYVNALTKATKGRFMLEASWEGDADDALAKTVLVIAETLKTARLALDESQQQNKAADELKQRILSMAKPLLALATDATATSEEVAGLEATMQREFASSILELCITAAQISSKVVLFMKDHPKDIVNSLDDTARVFNEFEECLRDVVKNSRAAATSETDVEDTISALAQRIGAAIEPVKSLFKAKGGEAAALQQTLSAVSEGCEALQKSCETAKAARLEREAAAKKRAEEVAARKAAVEERKRVAAEKKAAAARATSTLHSSGRTKEQLMRRLEGEARVFNARMMLSEQQKIVDALNAA